MGLVGIFPDLKIGRLFANPRIYKICPVVRKTLSRTNYLRKFEFVEKN